jgi:hypothetical protein
VAGAFDCANKLLGFLKFGEFLEDFLASREGLCSIKLVNSLVSYVVFEIRMTVSRNITIIWRMTRCVLLQIFNSSFITRPHSSTYMFFCILTTKINYV